MYKTKHIKRCASLARIQSPFYPFIRIFLSHWCDKRWLRRTNDYHIHINAYDCIGILLCHWIAKRMSQFNLRSIVFCHVHVLMFRLLFRSSVQSIAQWRVLFFFFSHKSHTHECCLLYLKRLACWSVWWDLCTHRKVSSVYSLISIVIHFVSTHFIAAEWLMNESNDMQNCIFYIGICSERKIIFVK